VTIPIEIRQRLNLEEGDLVAFIETKEGIVISPQEVVPAETLDKVESLLQQQGVELEDVFRFAERLTTGQLEAHPPSVPLEGPSVVERTAGIFRRRRGGERGPINFERARQAFIDQIAERAAGEDVDS
jgi:AbrB family looped-hinge helix DNA binding protein